MARSGSFDVFDDAAPEVVAVVKSFAVVLAAASVVFASEVVRLCGLLAPAVSDKAGRELAAIVRGMYMKADRRKDMGASGVRLTSRIKVIWAFGNIYSDPGTLPEDVYLSDEGLRSGLVGLKDANDRRTADGV